MDKIKSWLGKQIKDEQSKPLVVKSRHNLEELNQLTKKEVLVYARACGLVVNSRKKKEELIEIILRS
jgi:shikimate kinase